MIFQEPMSALNPSFTIGAQIAETVRLHQRTSKAASPRARPRRCCPRSASPSRRGGSPNIRTSFPAACASGR